ncbi:hypothetical protein PVAP13_5NG610529 [Panicum virgatum]|uniref:Uncharacterized protein n=1 Tax=Panicum virgatum TaxID=38727 RepID=A0A8T0S5Q2_PANVG|nr:hypothetical protein PVAP13_5NG610529 [Panicum virgatum]
MPRPSGRWACCACLSVRRRFAPPLPRRPLMPSPCVGRVRCAAASGAGTDAPITPVLITGLLVVGRVARLWTCTCHPTLPGPAALGTAAPAGSLCRCVRWSVSIWIGDCSRRGREGEYDMAGPSVCPPLLQAIKSATCLHGW